MKNVWNSRSGTIRFCCDRKENRYLRKKIIQFMKMINDWTGHYNWLKWTWKLNKIGHHQTVSVCFGPSCTGMLILPTLSVSLSLSLSSSLTSHVFYWIIYRFGGVGMTFTHATICYKTNTYLMLITLLHSSFS